MKPYECFDCHLQWEPTLFVRLFFTFWMCGLCIAVITHLGKTEFMRSSIGNTVVVVYISSLFAVPSIMWFIAPYTKWSKESKIRGIINYGCPIIIGLFAVYYYANT